MPAYIALLRGINIGPHKRMQMEALRACCDARGLKRVKTCIHSGNLVLGAAMSGTALSNKLAKGIRDEFGFSVEVIARTREQIAEIIQNNPFAGKSGIDPAKLHIAFLSEAPTAAGLKKLQEFTRAPDRARCSGSEIYFYFPNGVSGSSLWKHPLDRVLSVVTTLRNWNTVNKLYQMALECE
jgi:uncharacterized protein (DUF1697 family)